MRAMELPHTFDVRVGTTEYPFEVIDWDLDYVYAKSIKDNQVVNIPATFDNAATDIEFDLMQKGIV
jgi:hypothetical protein